MIRATLRLIFDALDTLAQSAWPRPHVQPGTQPARIHYFTVETRSGKRCCSIEQDPHREGAKR